MAFSEAFDLFAFLGTLSKRSLDAYDKLSPEGQKAVAPFVLQRWMTGTQDAAQIVRINTFVNPYAFSLGQDKALLCKLLAAAATGKTGRYSWVKGPGSKSEKLRLEVVKQFYSVSAREATSYNIDTDSIMEMAAELGWDEDELKKLKAEVAKDEPGRAEKPSGKPKKR
jgi:hypothetical protein